MQARLIESVELAPEVRHFVFEAEGAERFDFLPGQFVSLTAPIGDKLITRAYSLASAPQRGNRFELCLNRVPDGHLSRALFEMKPGDKVEMKPPLGMFTLRQPPRDSLFIATGTGIAPFRSMLQAHLTGSGSQEPGARRQGPGADREPVITLLFGVRYESHLMYGAEFEALTRRFPHFRYWPTLTRPDPGWRGRTGRVQTHLEEALDGRRDLDVYLCGLKAMVDEVRRLLKERGLDRKQIFYEKYD